MLARLVLYGKLVRQSFRAQLEYRANLLLHTLAHLVLTATEFLALWAMFDRFGTLGGFSLFEVAVFYGLAEASISIADAMSRGLDRFGDLLKSGDFDRLLLRPRGLVFQLVAQELTLRRAGRLVQALAVLGYGLQALDQALTPAEVLLLFAAIASGACVFVGLWILQAALCFYTTESLEAMNILTYGGAQLGQHPLSIFPSSLRRWFTAVVPVGLVVYYPGLVVMGRADPLGAPPLTGYLAPLAGPLFLSLAVAAFHLASRHHQSTGS